ncbi:MAG: M3 family metallopeptidase [Gammaproteobacteria bacterium]|nr:M3 family metallopeptidase [Gammaproteobacteria bacterium]
MQELLNQQLTDVQAALKTEPVTWQSLLQPLEETKNALEQFWAPFAHLHAVCDTPAIRVAYEACLPLLNDYATALQHNKKLYDAIRSVPQQALTPNQQKIIQDTLLDFELSGVHLSPKKKKRFQQIENDLSTLATQFENQLLDAEMAYELYITDESKLSGLPEHFLQKAKRRAVEKQREGWLLGIDPPSYFTLITLADNRELRKTLYSAYNTRASDLGPQAGQFDNTPQLLQILALRHEQAHLLRFSSYAEFSLQKKMASSVDDIQHFLEDLLERAHAQGLKEFAALGEFAHNHCQLTSLEPWDVAYVSQKKKQLDFTIQEEALRPYFPEDAVWKGIQAILTQLYGLHLKAIVIEDTWHPLVRCFSLVDAAKVERGYLYVDLYARPNKRGGAWMDVLQTRLRREDGSIQLPVATLTCNFSAPGHDQSATLLHDEVITLLHELGHCLQHLLSQVDEYSLSGIHEVEWDAVELASQLHEHWGWEPLALQQLSHHVETHQPLPTSLITQLKQTQTFQSGLAILRQLEFTFFDLAIHHQPPKQDAAWIHDTLAAIRKRVCVTPIFKESRFAQSFSHIFAGGYAAGYYSYLWAEILSSDVFSRFEEEGVFNAKTGQELMHIFLEAGSSKPAKTLFEAFMGRPASIQSFLRHRGIGC